MSTVKKAVGKVVNLAKEETFASELANELNYPLTSEQTEDITAETVIVADLDSALTHDHKRVIQAGVDKESTLVLNNTKIENFAAFSLFGVDADSVILKSENMGRRQKLVVEGESGATTSKKEAIEISLDSDSSPKQPAGHEITAPSRSLPQEMEELEHSEMENAASRGTERREENKPRSATRIARLIEGMHGRKAVTTRSLFQLEQVNPSKASGIVDLNQIEWIPEGKSKAYIFGQFIIELAAVNIDSLGERKVLKIKSDMSYVKVIMGLDKSDDQGFFTKAARVIIYPGNTPLEGSSSGWSQQTASIKIPSEWKKWALEPETANSVSTYTRTTGYSIGGSAGVEAGTEGAKATSSVSFSRSDSETYTEEIQDFRVKNLSTQAACDWIYEYSRVEDSWNDMFDDVKMGLYAKVKKLTDLSKTTMYLKNEVIYILPRNATGIQKFYFYILHNASRLSVEDKVPGYKAWIHNKGHYMYKNVGINLDMVSHGG